LGDARYQEDLLFYKESAGVPVTDTNELQPFKNNPKQARSGRTYWPSTASCIVNHAGFGHSGPRKAVHSGPRKAVASGPRKPARSGLRKAVRSGPRKAYVVALGQPYVVAVGEPYIAALERS